MEQNHIDHDRLFKELLENFFAEFMQLFFPQASRAIDFEHVQFLQQEVFTDVTAGERHIVDLLVETRLREEPGLILVHIEPQSYMQQDFNERMFIYFSRLYEKHRLRILPIAVFSYDQIRDEPDNFAVDFSFLEVLKFRFYKLELKKLYWRDYINSDNPVGAALLSKMGFKPEERVRVKVEFMRMLTRLRLDPARMELLGGFFESYLKLNQKEEEEFYRELDRIDTKEADKIMQITTSWHEKGRKEGRKEGRMEGRMEGRVEKTREVISKFLSRRFGEETGDLQQKVQEESRLEVLDRVLEELFAVNTLEEARAIILKNLSSRALQ
ncbi:Rpn family recombination-promoting nuclease/putative transposase [Moorella sp. Hama-1]|uniref:Rpn family recombination-promoting nuclease/putative transposase n=1 Tax=Moorella sp. Hama-1 TaxID=2138101 RepID=UPI000D650B63|nr:Rpn family recombination-promoting nuclease/putative transposase [Moorella sp. Hama-1]BCV22976.1 transposase [Moorella sp. Hama-1]